MSHSHKDVVVALLRDLTRQVQMLDEQELASVVAGNMTLQIRLREPKRSRKPSRQRSDSSQLQAVAELLKGFRTRDDGEKLLNEKASSKEEMVRLARILDLPVQRDDTIEQLRSKLIESTIGFRLRSAAIQGDSRQKSEELTAG